MQHILPRPFAASLIIIGFLFAPAALFAQSFWLERNTEKTFALELYNPVLSGLRYVSYQGASYPVDYSFNTFALFLSTRLPVAKNKFFVAELPFAHAEFDTKIDRDFSFFRNSGQESTIGNPYLGLELGSLASRFFTEIGIRLPLTREENTYAAQVGARSTGNRPESFYDFVAMKIAINYQNRRKEGLVFRLRVSAAYLHKFGELIQGHGFIITPTARIGYKTGRINAGTYLLISGEGMSIRSMVQRTAFNSGFNSNFRASGEVGLWANIDLGRLQPSIYINDFSTFGIGIQLR